MNWTERERADAMREILLTIDNLLDRAEVPNRVSGTGEPLPIEERIAVIIQAARPDLRVADLLRAAAEDAGRPGADVPYELPQRPAVARIEARESPDRDAFAVSIVVVASPDVAQVWLDAVRAATSDPTRSIPAVQAAIAQHTATMRGGAN